MSVETDARYADEARARLERAIKLATEYEDQMNEYGWRLVRFAGFSAFLDLCAAGKAAEARELIRRAAAS